MMFSDDMTLGEARAVLRYLVDEGHSCPLCTQFAKVYRRKIHATMAVELIRCWRGGGWSLDWFHLPTVNYRGGDVAKCKYWGLIEEDASVREDGSSRTGWWRFTSSGEAYVLGAARVRKYARVYDGRCLGFTGESVSIRDALGSRFSYDELMHGE
jgi:hypothetical protein